MSRVKLYSPPKGTYDMPYSWIYNLGSSPPDGQDLLNQFVYIQGGYGDFVLRRVAGLSRVLAPYTPGLIPFDGGQYRLYDRQHTPLASAPLYSWSSNNGIGEQDLGIVPEEFYKATGRIGFDLFRIARFPDSPNASQIAFQGVRRITGPYQRNPNYRAKARSFTYEMIQIIPDVFPGGPYTGRLKVTDYDFELYNIIILIDQNAFQFGGGEGSESINTIAALPGVTLTFEILNTPGQPFSLTVIGNAITVQLATDGSPATSAGDLLAAWNTTPAALALATLAITWAPSGLPVVPLTVIGPGLFGAPLTDTVASLLIYDGNKRPISSAPMLDIFCDGGPANPIVNGFPFFTDASLYSDGALVPPLWYPKDTQIQIDFYSQIETQFTPPVTLHVYLIGKQYYPC